MKVLFLSAIENTHTIRWVNALVHKGLEVTLVGMKNSNNEKNKSLIDIKVKIIYLPIKGKLGYYLNRFFINKIVEKENPDIINVHYASGYGTLGRFIKFENKLLNVWGSDVYDFPNQSKIKKQILIKNLNSYKAIASTSYCMAKETEQYLLKNQKIYITPFGVDIEKFKNLNLEKKEDKITIGIVKTLEFKYGVEYLIRAIKELEKILDKENFEKVKVKIYGKGYLKETLENLAKELKIEEKIKFEGFILNSEVPKAINEIDIFVVPSILDSESFGVAAVEAMACEVPVIVSDADGLKEVVIDNKTGFIVPKKDYKAIAEKIKILINDRELRKRLGKIGRERVIELYNWSSNVENMIDIYKKLNK